jgi:hypothetical protein
MIYVFSWYALPALLREFGLALSAPEAIVEEFDQATPQTLYWR